MQGSSHTSIARQPWFIPVAILLGIIVLLQMLPAPHDAGGVSSLSPTQGGSSGGTVGLEELRSIVKAEVTGALIEQARSVQHGENNANKYPPVKTLPEGQALRILVTGGSGFVGSHLGMSSPA